MNWLNQQNLEQLAEKHAKYVIQTIK